MHISKYQISNEGKYVKEVNDNVTKVYCKSIEIYGREKYIEIQDEVTVEMRNVIDNMNTNGQMTIESIFPLKEDPRNIEYYIELPVRIKESIMQYKACAALDMPMKGGKWVDIS